MTRGDLRPNLQAKLGEFLQAEVESTEVAEYIVCIGGGDWLCVQKVSIVYYLLHLLFITMIDMICYVTLCILNRMDARAHAYISFMLGSFQSLFVVPSEC